MLATPELGGLPRLCKAPLLPASEPSRLVTAASFRLSRLHSAVPEAHAEARNRLRGLSAIAYPSASPSSYWVAVSRVSPLFEQGDFALLSESCSELQAPAQKAVLQPCGVVRTCPSPSSFVSDRYPGRPREPELGRVMDWEKGQRGALREADTSWRDSPDSRARDTQAGL